MNISEANETNRLLDWILGLEKGATSEIPTDDEALEAAAFLAEKANKALSAGLSAKTVRAAWSSRRARVPDRELSLADVLKLFPGGMRGLADAASVATTVVYRFAWREHRHAPVEIAKKISAAIRKRVRAAGPLRDLGDVEALLDAWQKSPRGRIRERVS